MLIFVYGSLKRHRHNHSFLRRQSSIFIDNVKTIQPYYLFSSAVTQIPFMVEKVSFSLESVNIKGELWEVGDCCIGHLNSFERGYIGKRVGLVPIVGDGKKTYQALAYFATPLAFEMYTNCRAMDKFLTSDECIRHHNGEY